jgi:hypothetical protein
MYEQTADQFTRYASTFVELDDNAWRRARLIADVVTPDARLLISARSRRSMAIATVPFISTEATLRIGSLGTPLSVSVEVTGWSERYAEIGIRPPRHFPFWVSEVRYLNAASAVLDRLATTMARRGGARSSRFVPMLQSA